MGMFLFAQGFALAAQSHEDVKTEMANDSQITIEQAIHHAMKEVPGTVIKAELEKEHGPLMWEIEVVTADGKVNEVHIDGTSGKRLALHGSDEPHQASESGIHAGAAEQGSSNMSEHNMKSSSTEEPSMKSQP